MLRYINHNGYALAYESVGSGPKIVWVDPALASSALRPMQAAVHALAQRFEVVTYDRRGRGCNASTTDLTVDHEVADLAAVVAGIGNIAAVVGFSSGAALVLHAAAALDVAVLVLIEPAIDDTADETGLSDRVQADLEAGGHEAAVRRFYAATGVPEEILEGLTASPGWPDVVRAAPTLRVDLDLGYVSTEVLDRIAIPVHVIISDGSPEEITEMSERLVDRIPVVIWREPGGWHGVEAGALVDRLGTLVSGSSCCDGPADQSR